MKLPFKKLFILIVIVSVVVAVNMFFVIPGNQLPVGETDVNTCRPCHQQITDSFINTAHYYDSRIADSASIKGSFDEGKNVYRYNEFMDVMMVRDGERYWQAGRVNGNVMTVATFDMVIGSGRNGQSYLTWNNNQLFQLPVSYYRPSGQWCNSPGFPGYFFFGRKVPANCLECHSTSAKVLSFETMDYDKSSIVYGITCERCHPGAAEHAAFHTANPNEKTSKYVVNAARLGQPLRMDACALCHSGLRKAIQPAFSFTVGEELAKFSHPNPVSAQADTLDVHGNQTGLLMASKCYIRSNTMDCSTCHDVHKNEYRNLKVFSQRCMSCHNSDAGHVMCTVKPAKNVVLSDNCIDCHMPVLASQKIQLTVGGEHEARPDYLRTHLIKVWK